MKRMILFVIFLLMLGSVQAIAALSYTHLDTGNGSGGTTTFTTNSITVAANELVIIIFSAYNSTNAVAQYPSTVVYNGTGTSLTNIATEQFFTGNGVTTQFSYFVSAYYFIPGGASSGTISVTTTYAATDYSWSTFYFSGENTAMPIVQHTTIGLCNYTSGKCTSQTASLGSSIASNDATVAAFGNSGQAITATAGYNTIDNVSTNQYQLSEYEITGTQNPGVSWASADGGGLGFEVGVAPASLPPTTMAVLNNVKINRANFGN